MYFLDTPIFVHRMFGTVEERKRVERFVASGECVTSHYVKEQYRSTYLRAAVLLHNILRDKQDIPRTLRDLDRHPVTPGKGQKARDILCRILEELPGYTVSHMLTTLERWIEWEMLEVFQGVQVVDETRCCLCHGEVVRNEFGMYVLQVSCTVKEPRPCTIEAFWQDRSFMLERQARYRLDELPRDERTKNVAKARDACREVLDDNKPPRGLRCYVHLSDSVIAGESPAGATLATTNLRDFKALVRMIGGRRTVTNPCTKNR